MSIKIVNNANPGTADIVGGDDWDEVATIINTFESGGTITFRRTDAAGNQIIEFGPNQATGGAPIIDFHTDSGDGDYRTRFVRNTGTNGIFEFKQSGGGSFQMHHAANINTTTSQTRSLYLPTTIDTVGATPTQYNTFEIYTNYLATQPTSAFSLSHAGMKAHMDYGSAVVNAKGTVNMIGASIDCKGSASVDNEVNCLSLYNKASNSAIASQWLTDFIMYGPVTAQPGELSGITFLMNNYYNGSPSRRSSYFMALATNQDAGAFKSADHTAATAYKVDYGIMIQGYAGTLASPARGIETAILIGGNNSNWMNPASYNSKIGTGIQLKDIESKGIELLDPATTASSPAGFTSSGATRAWNYFIDLSGGLAPTTAAINVGTRKILGDTIMKMPSVRNFAVLHGYSAVFGGFLNNMQTNIGTVARTSVAADGIATTYLSGAVSGDAAGFRSSSSAANTVRQWNFRIKCRFKISATANTTLYIGVSSSSAELAGDNALDNLSGLVFGKRTADTNWFILRNDGDATQDVADTGTAVSTNITTIDIVADEANSRMGWSLNGGAFTYYTTEIPAATTGLFYVAMLETQETVAKTLSIYHWEAEQDR